MPVASQMSPQPLTEHVIEYQGSGYEREREMLRLQQELRNSRMEEERMVAAMKSQGMMIQRNLEELANYKQSMEKREQELQKLQFEEQQRLQALLREYQQRLHRERIRVNEALHRYKSAVEAVAEVLPELMACEKEMAANAGLTDTSQANLSQSVNMSPEGKILNSPALNSSVLNSSTTSQILLS